VALSLARAAVRETLYSGEGQTLKTLERVERVERV